ncbi:MAG: hypothetical protein ACK54C_12790, partial [Betaproteobacteria bacterium]
MNFAALFQEERGGVSKFCAGAMVWRYSALSERCSMVFAGFGGVLRALRAHLSRRRGLCRRRRGRQQPRQTPQVGGQQRHGEGLL